MILVIDNYDSFTYNLVQYLGELGADVRVRRNDQVTLGEIEAMAPEQIVISPGPGRPENAGITTDVIRRFGPTTPILGVCLGHQAIGMVYGGIVCRAQCADARQDVDRRARRQGRVRRDHRAVSGRALSLAGHRGRQRAWRARSRRAHAGGRHDHGGAASRVSGARRAVPSRVGADRGGAADSAELPRPVMFTAAHREARSPRGPHRPTRPPAAMREVMEGRAAPGALAGAACGAGDEGRAAGRDRRLRADDARARGEAVDAAGRRVRHVRHRRRSLRHVQYLVGGRGRRRGVRRQGGQARQPIGVEPVRQRGRVRAARRQRRGAAGGRGADAARRRTSRSSSRRRSIRR